MFTFTYSSGSRYLAWICCVYLCACVCICRRTLYLKIKITIIHISHFVAAAAVPAAPVLHFLRISNDFKYIIICLILDFSRNPTRLNAFFFFLSLFSVCVRAPPEGIVRIIRR